MRSQAVPIALTSSLISWRRPSNRVAAPENVNPKSSARRPNTAPSTMPTPARPPVGSRSSCLTPTRRPSSRKEQHAAEQAADERQRDEREVHGQA
jgi:hypothetical protein